MLTWQRSTLPHSHPCSTIDAVELNFPVRNGKECFLYAIITRLEIVISKLHKNYILLVKPSTYKYQSATYVTALPPLTNQPCVLQGVLLAYAMGNLILREASRLDAFSVYPFPT